MSRWFRFYDGALHDPKVQRLSGDLFKAWVNLLCLASHCGGTIPSAADVAFALRVPEAKAAAIVAELAGKGLLDQVPGGYFAPHNWQARQYKSDGSTERVKRFRKRFSNVSSAVSETGPEQNRTDIAPRKRGGVNGFKKISGTDYAKSWEIRSAAQLAEREAIERERKGS